jgi:hypothetical protein
LPTEQAREEATTFAATAFAQRALVIRPRQIIAMNEAIVGVQHAIPTTTKQRAIKAIPSGARHNRNLSIRAVEAQTRQAILGRASVSVTEQHYIKSVVVVSQAAKAKVQKAQKALNAKLKRPRRTRKQHRAA